MNQRLTAHLTYRPLNMRMSYATEEINETLKVQNMALTPVLSKGSTL
jgi:hypothetical protein